MEIITAFFESFLTDNLELSLPDGSFKYTLHDLKAAFDFALISEGVLKSDKIFDEANTLKVKTLLFYIWIFSKAISFISCLLINSINLFLIFTKRNPTLSSS
jgi:hypothetical protein